MPSISVKLSTLECDDLERARIKVLVELSRDIY